MRIETSLLAREVFKSVLASATGLGNFSKEERADIFKLAAEYCFEAAVAFEEVESSQTKG